MSISVVIPTYNGSAFIGATLESALTQTRLPDEIVVVDDCSTDDTCSIVERFAANSRISIRLIRLENCSGGPPRPMNVGLEHATSEYIALMDQDDLMTPIKLERQVAALEAHPDALLSFGDRTEYDGKRYSRGMSEAARTDIENRSRPGCGCLIIPSDVAQQLLIVESDIIHSCSNLVFPRRAWLEAGPFDERRPAIPDYVFEVAVARRSPFLFIPEVVFQKRHHPNNLSKHRDHSEVKKWLCNIMFEAASANDCALLKDAHFKQRFTRRFLIECSAARWCGDNVNSLWLAWRLMRVVRPNKAIAKEMLKSSARMLLDPLQRLVK